MKITFEDCLKRRRIIRFSKAKHLVNDELKDASEDLKSAKEEYDQSGFKWGTIKGYYSMFHSARALLYSCGYRERGHYCLYLAMKELYVKEGRLAAELAEDLKNAMILREEADYGRNFSQKGSKVAIKSAEKFYKAAKEICQTKEF